MKHCGTKTLETKRLILRRFREDDAEAMFQNWASDPEVTKFLTWPTHTSVDVSKYVLSLWLPEYEKPDYYHWVITLKENGDEPIGTIHGLIKDELDLVTAGYCLSRKYWHQGIMSEALQALIDFFFTEVQANCINSYHDPLNPNSGKVMMHCGMKFDGTLRASDKNNTGICDASWYSILREEWKNRRA
ncbi:MAG: GNAT family N-acetyltransferase [Clostridiales bacterium]|nr:GNAT family N-acetyltransferase [Clostridiales bacterium]